MKPGRRTYLGISAALIALVVALAAIAVFGVSRAVPERTIVSPAPAFAAETMYVAPGEEGRASGGEDESADEEDAKSDQERTEQEEERAEDQTEARDVAAEDSQDSYEEGGFTPEGGGNQSGDPDNPGNSDPDNPDPDNPDPDNPDPDNPDPDNPDPDPGPNPRPDPDPDPDPGPGPGPGPVIPSIQTNLMNYSSISADTAAPDSVSLTLEGKSGLDRQDHKLYFYAIPSDASEGYSVLVEYANDSSGWETTELEGSGGLFGLPVTLSNGSYTDVTLTLVDRNGARTNRVAGYRVTYEGRQGPFISVNFEDGQRFLQSPALITVTATDRYDGSPIYSDHISVTAECAGYSKPIPEQNGQYALDFDAFPLEGDDSYFTITVSAWDYSVEQASSELVSTIVYEHHPFGEVIGQATIVIDATPVGLGVVDTFSIDLHQGYPFPQDLVEGLTAEGLRPEYTGSFEQSFYLSGISSGGLFAGQSIDDELMHKIEQDKITWTGSYSADSLSDHDYTNVSGWLYNVNNSWWPSVSLDGYVPNPGDTVYLIYSVAGGKEVGSPYGGSGGALSSYCGLWRDGIYTEMHDLTEGGYKVMKEPTCSEPGEACYECSVRGCGAWGSVTGSHANGEKIELPATGEHDWVEDPKNSEEPGPGYDGVRAFKCSQCGETKTEPWVCEHEWQDDPDTTVAPTATEDGVHGYICALCGETKTEAWHCKHVWVEVGRTEPTSSADGSIEYECSECHATKSEVLKWEEPDPDPDPKPDSKPDSGNNGNTGGGSGSAATQGLSTQAQCDAFASKVLSMFVSAMGGRAS